MVTISSLSMPISGQNSGIFSTAPVTAIASIVWLATCPRFSPVTRHFAPWSRAMRSEMRIMNRRMMIVKYSSLQLSRMAS